VAALFQATIAFFSVVACLSKVLIGSCYIDTLVTVLLFRIGLDLVCNSDATTIITTSTPRVILGTVSVVCQAQLASYIIASPSSVLDVGVFVIHEDTHCRVRKMHRRAHNSFELLPDDKAMSTIFPREVPASRPGANIK